MPVLKIQTNQTIAPERQQALLRAASQRVAALLGKPERYVMIALERNDALLFGGSDAPLAYLELKSIGLPTARTAELSAGLCALLQQELGIDSERVYIEFANATGSMWGWNGGTF